jgi:hypothetical protein
MPDYLFLMHDDFPGPDQAEHGDDWGPYIRGL